MAEIVRSPRGSAPLTARGDAKREKILDAAAAVLAQSGYAGATLAEIAALAGTHAGSLYYYFASREDLVTEVLIRGVSDIHRFVALQLDAMAEDATSQARLSAAIAAHIEYMLERSNYALAGVRAVGQVPEVIGRKVIEHNRAYGRLFAELIDRAAADGFIDASVDLAAARMLIVGSANWTAEWFHTDGHATPESVAALLVRMVFEGLRPSR